MKIEGVLDAITVFFNDLVGAVIPGLVLIAGVLIIHFGHAGVTAINGLQAGGLFVGLGLAFAIGHSLLAIYDVAILWLLAKIKFAKTQKAIWEEVGHSKVAEMFRSVLKEKFDVTKSGAGATIASLKPNELRSMAMSISPDAANLARRFMFLSLLCSGAGTALVTIAIYFVSVVVLIPKALAQYPDIAPVWIQFIALIALSLFTFKRGTVFYERAMYVPFSMTV